MNSLTYLSRQFDVLASPKNTPATEPSSFIPDTSDSDSASDQPALKRVRTWSSRRGFLTPKQQHKQAKRSQSQDSLNDGPKRTQSSPAEFDFLTMGNGPRKPPRKKSFVITSFDSGNGILVRSKPPAVEAGPLSTLRRTLVVRVFVVVWDALCKAWAKIRRDMRRARKEANMEEGHVTDESGEEGKSAVLMVTSPPSSPHHEPLQGESQPPNLDSPPPYAPSEEMRRHPHLPAPRRTPFHQLTKTLVLDLDETLIHSTTRSTNLTSGSGGFFGLSVFGRGNSHTPEHTVEVYLGGRSTIYHVYKRPHVDYFLRKVSKWYKLVIFTASLQEYADPVIDWLDDGCGLIEDRFFRDSCTQLPDGSYSKDLTLIEPDLSRICLLDNSPISYKINEANGIPVEGWTHDPYDEGLLDLLPVLDSLRFTGDVRRVLGIRGFS